MSRGLRFSISATDKSKAAFKSVQDNISQTRGLQRSWNAGLNANRRAVQQFGFQMSDFAIQIAGGQSAMLAFTQQGGQMLQFFGPAGAIAAAFLAVFGSLAIAFTRSGKALSDLTPIMGVLAEDFAAIGRLLHTVKELMIDFANVVLNNMDRIIVTLATVATVWILKSVAMRLATVTLAGALMTLRTALIRLGIGALIVGAGELVYQFTRLVKGAGSVGEAMRLMWAVVDEVTDRIGLAFQAAWQWVKGVTLRATADMMDALLEWVDWMPTGVINVMIGLFKGAYDAVIAVWNLLPDMMRLIGGLAMNALIDRLERGLTGIVSNINAILRAVRMPEIEPPDLSDFRATLTQVQSAGAAVRDAFADALSTDYVGDFTNGARDVAESIRDMGNQAVISSGILADALGRPIQSWQDLKDAIRAADEAGEDIDIRDWFTGGGGDGEDAGGGGGGRGGGRGSATDQITEQADAIKAIFDDMSKSISTSLGNAFKGLIDGTKSLKDVAIDMFTSILQKLTETMTNPLWDRLGQGLTDLLVGTPSSSGFGGGLLSSVFNSIFGGGAGASAPSPMSARSSMLGGSRSLSSSRGRTPLEVHVHENATDGPTRVEQSGDRIDVFMRKAVQGVIADGGADRAIRSRYGIRPQPTGGM